MQVSITKLTITIGKRTIELTSEEAVTLQQELNQLFNRANPAPVWPTPIIIDRYPHNPILPWEVTYTSLGTAEATLRIN